MSQGTGVDMEEDDLDTTWIKWFCAIPGNEFFCEVDKAFIEDSFNLFGIKQIFPHDYGFALATILDRAEYDEDDGGSEDGQQQAAEMLYGMIHARFLLTGQGLVAMHRKYQQKLFGECPRTCCNGQAVLPVGLSDDTTMTPVKVFCPRCRDIYNCPQYRHIDGAFFGTTFAHMFLLTFENLVPVAPTHHYVPRVFGFKIHPSSACIPSDDHLPNHTAAPVNAPAGTYSSAGPAGTAPPSSSTTNGATLLSSNIFPLQHTALTDHTVNHGPIGTTGHTLTPLPQSALTTSHNNNIPHHVNNSSHFFASSVCSLPLELNGGVGGEKTDKSTSKDYFDEDEEDEDERKVHDDNNNELGVQALDNVVYVEDEEEEEEEEAEGVVASGVHRYDYSSEQQPVAMHRDESIYSTNQSVPSQGKNSNKRRRKQQEMQPLDQHLGNDDIEVLMVYEDTPTMTHSYTPSDSMLSFPPGIPPSLLHDPHSNVSDIMMVAASEEGVGSHHRGHDVLHDEKNNKKPRKH